MVYYRRAIQSHVVVGPNPTVQSAVLRCDVEAGNLAFAVLYNVCLWVAAGLAPDPHWDGERFNISAGKPVAHEVNLANGTKVYMREMYLRVADV